MEQHHIQIQLFITESKHMQPPCIYTNRGSFTKHTVLDHPAIRPDSHQTCHGYRYSAKTFAVKAFTYVLSSFLSVSQSPKEMLRNQAASYQFVCLPGFQPCSESHSYSGNLVINHSSSCPVIQPVRYLFTHFVSKFNTSFHCCR